MTFNYHRSRTFPYFVILKLPPSSHHKQSIMSLCVPACIRSLLTGNLLMSFVASSSIPFSFSDEEFFWSAFTPETFRDYFYSNQLRKSKLISDK